MSMKELSIEAKAKRYNKAIEIAKSKIKNDKDHVLYEDDVIEIFPELKVSDDEKMRESIICALRNGGFYNNDKTDEAIAWLEKQSEQKSADKVEPISSWKPTSDHWQDLRERVAIAVLQAMVTDKDFQRYSAQYKSEMAITHADALVKKLKGK